MDQWVWKCAGRTLTSTNQNKCVKLIGSSDHSVWQTFAFLWPPLPSAFCWWGNKKPTCRPRAPFTVSTCYSCVTSVPFKQEGRFIPCLSSSCVFLWFCVLFLHKIRLSAIAVSYNWGQPLGTVLLCTTPLSSSRCTLFSGSRAVLRPLHCVVLFLFFFTGCFIHVQICNVFDIRF